MGYNISGIVINKDLENLNVDLQKILNLDLEYECDIDFETASENWKDENIVDVYSSKNGTLIFTNFERCFDECFSFADAHILTFAISETSMSFYFAYSINEKLIRSLAFTDDEIVHEQGLRLKVEDENEDISEVIWKQIEMVLGKSYWEINIEEKAKRYRIITPKVEIETEQIETEENKKSVINTSEEKSKKNNGLVKLYLLVSFAILLVFGLIYVIYNILMLP